MSLASPATPARNRRARLASRPHLAWVFALQSANQNLSVFFSRKTEASYLAMNSAPDPSNLFPDFSPVPQMVFVNERFSFQTEGNQRVILVHGVVHSHYSREDRTAETYALVSLYESGYADQNDLARSFGYSTRTLRRFQERLHSRGLSALVRPAGRPADGSLPKPTPRDRTILRLKAQGISNRGIAGRLGLSEMMIRKILRRLGWQPAPEAALPLLPPVDAPAKPVTISDSSADQISRATTATSPEARTRGQTGGSELRCKSVGPLHGSSLGGHGAARRRAAPVCNGTESASCWSFVGHPGTGHQWTAVGGGEDLRKPPPLLLWHAHNVGRLCSVSSSPHPTPGGAQGIFPPGNWAALWGWTACRKSRPCAASCPSWRHAKAARHSVRRSRSGASENMATCSASSTSMVMCALIMANTRFPKPISLERD